MRNVVTKWSILSAALLGALSLGACGGGGDDDGGDGTLPTDGDYYHYVTNTVKVPQSSSEAMMYGLNVDDDENGEVDNALGRILATLKTQGVDIQTQVNDAVAGGDLILLHSIRANDIAADTSVSWEVYLGESVMNPDFSGAGMFTVAADSPQDAILAGRISSGAFSGGPGKVTIQLSLTAGTPVNIELVGTKIEANVTADGCTDGILGGAITEEKLNQQVIPAIADLLNDSVADDGGTMCTAQMTTCPMTPDGDAQTCDTERMLCVSSTSKTVLGLFDDNKDKMITSEEIMNDPLIKALLEPDVDLLDASNVFQKDPAKRDEVKDSLSLGLGFTCAKGTFTAPGE
jgi:hypothetical protein